MTAATLPSLRLQAAFWRSPLLDVLVAFVVILTFTAPVTSGFRPSHAGVLLFSGVALMAFWDRPPGRSAMIALFLFLSVIVTSTISAFLHGPGNYLVTSQFRNAMMFGGIFLAGYSLSAERLRIILGLTPYLCAAAIIYILAFRADAFALGRLSYGEYLFAPGLSYVITLCLAILLAKESKGWRAYLLIVFLLLAQAATLTRAEIIAIFILFWIRIGFRRGLIMAAAILIPLAVLFSGNAGIQRLLIIRDIAETGGSGRLQVWSQLIQELLDRPSALLFGFGPGHVNYVVSDFQSVDKAHNIPLDTLYSYGLFGFSLLISLCAILFRKIAWSGGTSSQFLARDIVIVSAVNGMFNGSFFDGSLNGLSAICFAFVLAVMREQPRGEGRVPPVVA